jgi:hypothetical protein
MRFYETWLPLIIYDEEKGKYVSSGRPFRMPYPETQDDKKGMYNRLLFRLANTEKTLKKEVLGAVQEATTSAFQPKVRYRIACFDLNGQFAPDQLAFLDVGSMIEKGLKELAWGRAVPEYPDRLHYGPLFTYDIHIEKYIDEKSGYTNYRVKADKDTSPFKDQLLAVDMKNRAKYEAWYNSLDLNNYFTKEQLEVIENVDFSQEILKTFDFISDEKIAETLQETPLDLSAVNRGKSVFLPKNQTGLISKLTEEAKRFELGVGKLYMLEVPKADDTVSTDVEISINDEVSVQGTTTDRIDSKESNMESVPKEVVKEKVSDVQILDETTTQTDDNDPLKEWA